MAGVPSIDTTKLSASITTRVDPEVHARFLDVLGDDDAARTGSVSLLFPMTLATAAYEELAERLAESGQASAAVVHLGRSVQFLHAIEPAEALSITVKATSFVPRPGGGEVTMRTTISDGTRVLVDASERALLLGTMDVEPFGKPEPPRQARRARLHPVEPMQVPADVGQQWASVSGDYQAIHLDDAVARSYGFERTVAHGAYTLAVALRTVVTHAGGGDPRRVRSVRCSFGRPLYPGDKMTVHLSSALDGVVHFRVIARGQPVLRSGTVEFGEADA